MFPLISITFVCVVVHAIEQVHPVVVIMIIKHSLSKLKLMHTLCLLWAKTSDGLLWI